MSQIIAWYFNKFIKYDANYWYTSTVHSCKQAYMSILSSAWAIKSKLVSKVTQHAASEV